MKLKLDYKNKKWDKEVMEFSKVWKDMKGEFTSTHNIKYFEKILITDSEPDKRSYDDFLEVCAREYDTAAEEYYIQDITDYRAVDYTYLSGWAGVRKSKLFGEEPEDENPALQSALYKLIATGQTQTTYLTEPNGIISYVYNGCYEKARELLDRVEEDTELVYGSYYTKINCLKRIYMAILDGDETAFNEELMLRIKKYRRNMVGWTTIIDYISVALIKMAQKAGINYTFDVIEIPKLFFDEAYKIDKEQVRFAYEEEVMDIFKQRGIEP